MCYGGDFNIAVQQALRTSDMKVFLGYCGWDKAELDAEMEEGSWVVVDDMTLF
ncbi:YqgE/AlgH family protein [Chitinophaga sedimenti]|nr:YqgE/AlgH family protein [Chitinophaga sedimenti]